MLRHWTKLVVAFALALCCVPATAENFEGAFVTGAGQVTLHPKATLLRFQLTLSARGDDMQQTQASIERKGEAFRKALLAAKATPESIRISTPKLTGGLRALGDWTPGRQDWQQGGKGGGKGESQYPLPQTRQTKGGKRQLAPRYPSSQEGHRGPRIDLHAQLVAEWPLPGATSAELLVEGDRIVREAYQQMRLLFPRKETDDDEAEAESSERQSSSALGQRDRPDFSRPMYVFVGVIAEQELRAAEAKAFQAATADAMATAQIARLVIGELLTLNVSGHGVDADPFGEPAAPTYSTPVLPAASDDSPFEAPVGASAAKRHGKVEVSSYDPSSLTHAVTVNVTFRLPSSR